MMSGTVRRVASTVLPTKWGTFQMIGFERPPIGGGYPETAIALILGDPTLGVPLLRIHSQCFTGDVLGIPSLRLRRPIGTGHANHCRGRMRSVDL